MRSIILSAFGGVENLVEETLPDPLIAENEVLVQVKAISINPVDVKTRIGKGASGAIKSFHPMILGWDISGTVLQSNSPRFGTGDDVFGMINFPGHGKAYSTLVAAPAVQLAVKPSSITHAEAAAATLAALTAWQNLSHYANVQPGQRVLIHAAAGGVGHYAVQMARHLRAYVIGTCSERNSQFVIGLGANETIDYKKTRFEQVVKDIDLVLDSIGGDNIDRSLEVLRKGGMIISLPSGLNEQVKAKAEARGVHGLNTMVKSSGKDMEEIARLLENNSVKSHVSKTFHFSEMRQAHLEMESGRTIGKMVISLE